MILEELLISKTKRKKVIPFIHALLTTLRINPQPSEAGSSFIFMDYSLSDTTGTRTIASINLEREKGASIGSNIMIMLRPDNIVEYPINAIKTHFRSNILNKILRETNFSSKQSSTTGYFIEKYFFFSYLRLMRRENIWANSLFLVKKPF